MKNLGHFTCELECLQYSRKTTQKCLVIYCWRMNHPKLRDLNIEKQHLFADNFGIWLRL